MQPGDFYKLAHHTRAALLADWRLSHETPEQAKSAQLDAKRRRISRLQDRQAG